jgi:hypothetical protein
MECERCGAMPILRGPLDAGIHDYCAVCGTNLCPPCMAEGCCHHVPALSGNAEDYGDEEEATGATSHQTTLDP